MECMFALRTHAPQVYRAVWRQQMYLTCLPSGVQPALDAIPLISGIMSV